MRRIGNGIVRAASVLVLLASEQAAAQTLFQMDMSAAGAPYAGWGTSSGSTVSSHEYQMPAGATVDYAHQRLPIGNWNGSSPAYEFHISNTREQFYIGWRKPQMEPTPPGNGQTRYFRFRIWFDPTSRFLGASQLNNKMVMFADGNTSRIILHLNSANGFESEVGLPAGAAGSGLYGMMSLSHNIGTGTAKQLIELNRWYHVQGSFTLSNAAPAANGILRLWVNNNTQGSPTRQVGNLPIYSTTQNDVSYGRYWSQHLNSGLSMKWRMSDFVYSTAFDSSWFPGGGGTGGGGGGGGGAAPSTPQNLTLVRQAGAGAGLALVSLVVGMLTRRSRRKPTE